MSIVNPVNFKQIEKLLYNFMPFALDRMEIDESPSIRFAKDPDNAKDPLGKTGYYEPDTKMITVYVDGRHPKDIMRSISHELVHHAQNLRGDLQNTSGVGEQGYAQNDEHLREMEREAYEQGNLCFRDWEDGLKMSNTRLYEAMQVDRDDLIDMIRDYSRDLTGFRDIYGNLDKLATMDDDELDRYYKGMFDSPEAQDMERRFRDEEEAEMGTDDDFDRMPKQSGFGRGMREELNLFERVSRSFGYRLNENDGDQLRQMVARMQDKYNLSQEEALEAIAKMLSAMEKHETERRVSDYTAQSKFREAGESKVAERSDDDERDLEEPVKYGSGAELEFDTKAQKFYDRKRDMYIDDPEEEDNLVKERLATIMSDDAKMNQFLAKVTETLGLDHEEFVKLYSQRVASAKQNKGDLKQMTTEELTEFLSSKINKNIKKNNKQSDDNKKALEKDKDDEKEIKKEYIDDEFDMDPHEDEEINALLAKYGLDDDSTPVPADADAEAAAERDSMGEFDAEEDEEDEPIMMKEKEPEQMELGMDTSAPAGMTVEKFADMFDLDPEQDNDGQVIFYASSEMGPKLTELIKQARDAGYDMAQNNDGSITIYTDEYPSHGEEPVRGFGITMEKKSDEDGDGDIDSDDYMAKKDKAIKKAMDKEEVEENKKTMKQVGREKRAAAGMEPHSRYADDDDKDKEDVNEQMGEDLVAKVAELMETDPEYQHTLKPFVQKFLDVSQGPASRGPAKDLEAILPEWVPGQDIHSVIKKAQAGSAPMEESFDQFHSDRRNTMLNEALMKWCTK